MSLAPTKAATDRAIWQMAAAQTIIWAALYYVFPAMLPAWEADFGWSKTTLSLAFSLALVTAAVFAPLVGRMIDRRQGPQVMTAGAVGGAVLLSVLTVA
ncbi:MAG: MFS transporter, partial [Pseudomonadota bacterium]|nr:MFS transporter [Pseudomonadota bacterium]